MSRRLLVLASVALAAAATSCSTADTAKRVDPVGPPPDAFEPVAVALAYRCGSLDCHGTPYRNMRVYGYGSMRLDPSHTPATPIAPTRAEVQATYDSIVALEPEVMRQLVVERSVGPTRLTFVRKGRGEEAHEGGQRIAKGDDADTCVLSWLRGTVDVAACKRVVEQF